MKKMIALTLAGIVLSLIPLGTGCSHSPGTKKIPSTCPGKIRFEHIALNVESPESVSQWYQKYLGMQVVRKYSQNAIFISDFNGYMMFELYRKPEASMDFSSISHEMMHISFMAEDVAKVQSQLTEAGAVSVGEIAVSSNGDRVLNMRDPWGIPIQFVQRGSQMVSF